MKLQEMNVINNTKRIKVENANIKGSISLQGAIIDDIIFQNYNETLNGENKVIFLNPKKILQKNILLKQVGHQVEMKK